MKRHDSREHALAPQTASSNLTYYLVMIIAGLVGLASYNSGATIEGALARTVLVLLACTILGYALNVFLLLSGPGRKRRQRPASRPGVRAASGVGTRVDVTTGDDDELPTTGPGRQPAA